MILCRTPGRHDAETIIADLRNLYQIATFILATTQTTVRQRELAPPRIWHQNWRGQIVPFGMHTTDML